MNLFTIKSEFFFFTETDHQVQVESYTFTNNISNSTVYFIWFYQVKLA